MGRVIFDSVNIHAFPSGGFDATAGYVNGRYRNSDAMRARWPHLPHISIAVTKGASADCLDIEPGNAGPEDGPGWIDRVWNRRLSLPIIYCGARHANEVRAHLGARKYILWVADYTYSSHICRGDACKYGFANADGTQWADRGPRGENVDQSLINDRFWSVISGQVEKPKVDPLLAVMPMGTASVIA